MVGNKIELKPCPFCGAKPQYIESKYTYGVQGTPCLGTHYEIFCPNCGIQTSDLLGGTKESVLKVWNRRVTNG